MKTSNQEYGEALLVYWGKWVKSFILGGYPKETQESILMREGAIIKSTGKPEGEDDVAEKVESIVMKMPPEMRKVVKIEYLTYNTRKIKWKKLGLSEWTYTDLLRRAQDKVASEFDHANVRNFV